MAKGDATIVLATLVIIYPPLAATSSTQTMRSENREGANMGVYEC